MKSRILSFFLAFTMLFTLMQNVALAVTVGLTMDKQIYYAGENHTVNYSNLTGSGPWWGVYNKDDIPGTSNVGSKLWNYISAPSGTINFNNSDNGSASTWATLSTGDYKLCIFADESKTDGKYNVVAQAEFTIKAAPNGADAPLNVEYQRNDNLKRGFADGKIILTPPSNRGSMTGYTVYWGNDNGPFEDYAPIKIDGVVDSGKTTRTYTIVQNTYIPVGTTKMYAYSAKGTNIASGVKDISNSALSALTSIPQNSALTSETPRYSFQVTSDWHMFAAPDDNIKAKRLSNMFNDVKTIDPDSSAIVAVGDVTDNSLEDKSYPGISPQKANAEFDMLNKVIDANKTDLPELVFAAGNHDLRGNDGYQAQVDRFLTRTGTEGTDGKLYYFKEINGAKFIVLGSEHTGDNEYLNAELSQTQLTWFENTLKEHSNSTSPIFVFLHQPLMNTTAGTTNGFRWYGVNQNSQVREILKKYPQAVWFSGHTHWELEAKNNMYTGYGNDFSAFNDAGVGKIYTDEDKDKEGSQGLYVEVYKDKILVKGRDFENKLWVTSAQFMIDSSLPSQKKAEKFTTDTRTMIRNEADIDSLYNELSALGEDKGGFTNAYSLVLNAKNTLAAADKILKDTVINLDTLSFQTAKKDVDITLLNKVKDDYKLLNTEQKAVVPDAQTIIDQSVKADFNKKSRTLNNVTIFDSKSNIFSTSFNNGIFSVSLSQSIDLKVAQLSLNLSNSDATVKINGVPYIKDSKIDLSNSSNIKITVVSPFGENYNTDYTLVITRLQPPKLKNGWVFESGKYYLYKNNIKIKNSLSKQSNSKTYCSDNTGARVINKIYTVKDKTYAFDKSGYMITGTKFVTYKEGTYFVKSGKVLKNKVFSFKNALYMVTKAGKKVFGNKIVSLSKDKYFVNKKGVILQKSWKKYKNNWYYAGKNGKFYLNTTKNIGGKRYKFDKKGVCVNR